MKTTNKVPVMICTYARGGMRSVVEGYNDDGLTGNWNFKFIWSHHEAGFVDKTIFSLKAWFKFLILLLKQRVSFAHIHSAMRGSFWRKTIFSKTAHLFGVPTIMHLHGSEMESFYDGLSDFGKTLIRWSLETADTVIVLSESWHVFVKKIAPKAHIKVINNYVRPPESVKYLPVEGRFNVLFLGVLGQRKGIYDLIQAWALVVKQIPYAKLIVGGNGEIDKAQQLSRDLGLENSIQFLGWVSGNEKLALLNEADVFVLPSYNEGLPMSVLEAMSWERAVITTTVGGIPELITDRNNGLLISPGDLKALAACLILLQSDPVLRTKVGENARALIIDRFSHTAVIPQVESVYKEINDLKK